MRPMSRPGRKVSLKESRAKDDQSANATITSTNTKNITIMKRFLTSHPILCGALLAVSLSAAPAADERPKAGSPRMARGDAVLVTLTASVEAIDQASREVTL